MTLPSPSFGLIGLGTMGSNLALNIAEKGYDVAVYNRTASRTEAFIGEAGELAPRLVACDSLEHLVTAMRPPRNIISISRHCASTWNRAT
jgi:6-phosphogluconate dehydrogenase